MRAKTAFRRAAVGAALVVGLAPAAMAVAQTDAVESAVVESAYRSVPCPEGTSATVVCTLNDLRGYEMVGTDLDEVFIGSQAGVDRMYGHGGDDVMRGGRGIDTMRGGPGDDVLKGGPDDDTLYGGPGRDRLIGNQRHDWLVGGSGRDTFRGNYGRDVVDAAGETGERINCGPGRDLVLHSSGDRVASNCERV